MKMIAMTLLLIGGICSLAAKPAEGQEAKTLIGQPTAASEGPRVKSRDLVVQRVEDPYVITSDNRNVSWLGVGTEEVTEAMATQLGLNSGEGLVVSYVAPESPANIAGIKKHDVLVQFDDQLLVHPAQLRKLVQSRKEGDTITISYIRNGKRFETTAMLKKAAQRFGFMQDERSWEGDLKDLPNHFRHFEFGEKMKEEMNALQEQLRKSGVDRQKLEVEIRRSVEEAEKGLREAMRGLTNTEGSLGPARRMLREITRKGVGVDKNASITVRNSSNQVKTLVTTDETGTYVLIEDPNKHLSVHDKSGRLLFEGPVNTVEEQGKVPRELWERVAPMFETLRENDENGTPEKGLEGKAEGDL